jgi:adenylate kinase family enzyme
MSNVSKLRRPPRIIMAGAPASGKGTQCEYIRYYSQMLGILHLVYNS